jgi:hypothetical protein
MRATIARDAFRKVIKLLPGADFGATERGLRSLLDIL